MIKSLLAVLMLLQAMLASLEAGASPEDAGNVADAAKSRPLLQGGGLDTSFDATIGALKPEKRQKAIAILQDSLPGLRELDMRITMKMQELAALDFKNGSDPEQLSRLGLELQGLRNAMRARLLEVRRKLQMEAGVRLAPPMPRGCRGMRSMYASSQTSSHASGQPAGQQR